MRYVLYVMLMLAVTACARQEAPPAAQGLESLRGQWVLINYWARWCKPCIEEIPELNELNSKHEDITVLGVNYDGATGEDLAQQVQQLGVEFAGLEQDPAAELGVPRPVVLPSTLVVDPSGTVVETLVGPQTLDTLEQTVSKLRDAAGA